MLTGRLPFDGEYEQAILYSIINEDPPPITGLRAGVPLELDRIIGKALAKQPAERYQHVDDFATDLRAVRRALDAGVAKSKTEPAEIGKDTHDGPRWKIYAPWAIAALLGAALLFLLIQDEALPPAPPREASA
jgi:serine/threonine-protein kinase